MTVKAVTRTVLLLFVAVSCVVLVVKRWPQTSSETRPMQDGVRVYYLHTNTRCTNCRAIEAYAQEAVANGFADQVRNGTVEWQVVNYETPGNEHLASDYQVVAPMVVLVKFADGKQTNWRALPEVWQHVDDKPAFIAFVQENLRQLLDEQARVPQ